MAPQPGCTMSARQTHSKATRSEAKRRQPSPSITASHQPPPPGQRMGRPSCHGMRTRPAPAGTPHPHPPGDRVPLDTAPGRSRGRHRPSTVPASHDRARGSPCRLSPSTGVHKSGSRRPAEGVLSLAWPIGRLEGPLHGPPSGSWAASGAQPHSSLVLVLAGFSSSSTSRPLGGRPASLV